MPFGSKHSKQSYGHLFGESDAIQGRPSQGAGYAKQSRRRGLVIGPDDETDESLFGGNPPPSPPPRPHLPSPSTNLQEQTTPDIPTTSSATFEPPSPTPLKSPESVPPRSPTSPHRNPYAVVDQQSATKIKPSGSFLTRMMKRPKKSAASFDTVPAHESAAYFPSTEPHIKPSLRSGSFHIPKPKFISRVQRLHEPNEEDGGDEEEEAQQTLYDHIPDEATQAFAKDLSLRCKIPTLPLTINTHTFSQNSLALPTPSVSTPTLANPWSDAGPTVVTILEPTTTTSTPVGGRNMTVKRSTVPGFTNLADRQDNAGNHWAEEENRHQALVNSLVAEQPDLGYAVIPHPETRTSFIMEDPWRDI